MAKSTADKAVDTFVAGLFTPPATSVSNKKAEIEKRKKRLEELKATPVPASSDISESEKKIRELEGETSAFSLHDSSSEGSSSSSKSLKMEVLLKRKAEAEARLKSVSEGKITFVSTTGTSSRIAGIAIFISSLPSSRHSIHTLIKQGQLKRKNCAEIYPNSLLQMNF